MSRTIHRMLSIVAIAVAVMSLPAGGAKAEDATVDLTAMKQSIRGFGASSAWCGTISTNIMDSLYSDLGYSILRVRIEESVGDGWSSGSVSAWQPELTNAQNAIARGAIVFASPWNPPASMKSGGKLMTSKYADYANYLKAYAKYFSDNGAPLYAISIQNEPDYANDWTAWTATDLLNFLSAEGAALSSVTKIMMPESFQFRHEMSDPSLNDPTVASYISIVGGHLYGAGLASYPLATDQGKELWETEHYFDDDSIGNVMSLGKEVHDCMVKASMNAYVYWWITWPNGLADSSNDTIFKRAYALGQFAKYIRPGFHRVDVNENPATNLSVSAYTGDDSVVIVAVNTGTTPVDQNFVVQGGSPMEMSSFQTSASANMEAGQTYTVTNGSFMASLPGQSITTFVGSLGQSSGSGGAMGTGGTGTGGMGATGGIVSTTGGIGSTGGAIIATGGMGVTGGAIIATGGMDSTLTGGIVSATGGTPFDGTVVPASNTSSGCSCTLGAPERGGRERAFGASLMLLGLLVARRRARTRSARKARA